MNKEKEIRKLVSKGLEVRELEDTKEKLISGYIVKYNTRSEYMGFYEEVAPGAFDKTLADGHNIYAMYSHRVEKILGATRNSTLKLSTDDIGLKFEIRVNPKLSYANDIYNLVKDGTIEGCSFGFFVNEDEWRYTEEKIDLRTLKEIELDEVSIVPYPAYSSSQVSCRSFKNHKEEMQKSKELNELKEDLELIELNNSIL
ncbi:HK97 family phage prohead protease [Clostridium botulinum]|uniref:HK97 family phage prohead protease n=1 Tax=Clostridium botulinum TaxID=1491 RepID=UPI00069BE300|nr:HK97 family phage prohead protease [Clostridium botulinum]KOA90867.1 peptidase U35 [Clostridium botulinum]MCD3203430.1 HK97 family phage prohead protease [Clostridium botulinum C/D]MCD3222293.1 HK97 family phage prohead protease [Clostridium botulinum C/D]MCD3231436.1 HK97 family phage prohead protease [Clostridium botulinum C/D]MCD3273066.1 HK97 family phage prohead protease [Clostridium botulinum C/D]